MAWDVLSGAAKMAWDVLSRVTKTAWDVLSRVTNQCGMFCPGWQKMAWDVLSRDVLSYIPRFLADRRTEWQTDGRSNIPVFFPLSYPSGFHVHAAANTVLRYLMIS